MTVIPAPVFTGETTFCETISNGFKASFLFSNLPFVLIFPQYSNLSSFHYSEITVGGIDELSDWWNRFYWKYPGEDAT